MVPAQPLKLRLTVSLPTPLLQRRVQAHLAVRPALLPPRLKMELMSTLAASDGEYHALRACECLRGRHPSPSVRLVRSVPSPMQAVPDTGQLHPGRSRAPAGVRGAVPPGNPADAPCLYGTPFAVARTLTPPPQLCTSDTVARWIADVSARVYAALRTAVVGVRHEAEQTRKIGPRQAAASCVQLCAHTEHKYRDSRSPFGASVLRGVS